MIAVLLIFFWCFFSQKNYRVAVASCPWPLSFTSGARTPLPIGCCSLAVAHPPLPVGRCPLALARWPLPVSCCPSAIACWPLPVGPCPSTIAQPLPVSRCLSALARWPLLVGRCPSDVASCLVAVDRPLLPLSVSASFFMSRLKLLDRSMGREAWGCMDGTWEQELRNGTVRKFFSLFFVENFFPWRWNNDTLIFWLYSFKKCFFK